MRAGPYGWILGNVWRNHHRLLVTIRHIFFAPRTVSPDRQDRYEQNHSERLETAQSAEHTIADHGQYWSP